MTACEEAGEHVHPKYPVADGRGIFLCYVCDSCASERLRGYRPEILSGYLLEAVLFAEELHRGEFREPREAGVPYVEHPLRVAALLARTEYDDDEFLVPALLHDVVESALTRGSWAEVAEPLLWRITDRFGPRASDAVWELTDQGGPRDARRRHQLRHVYGPVAAPIKIADKTCNVRDLARTRHRSAKDMAEYLEHAQDVVAISCGAEQRSTLLNEAWDEAVLALAFAIDEMRRGGDKC